MLERKIIPVNAEGAGVSAQNAPSLVARLQAAKALLRQNYCKRHNQPWIVAYSGGKDSTLLLHLVMDTVQSLPAEQRRRQVHIVANDTLVESPPVIDHLHDSLARIRRHIARENLPFSAVVTKPSVEDTFWVNVIGRGYIPPTRNFRWCTDRLKIIPTSKYIERIAARRPAILLIGTRKSESQNRGRRMAKTGMNANNMNAHSTIKGCRVFMPLADFSDDDVWMTLLQNRPPWGGAYRNLITLYRSAGKENFHPCRDLHARLLLMYKDTNNRMRYHRNGSVKRRKNGDLNYGPFKLEVRREILRMLTDLEAETGRTFINIRERATIEHIWLKDQAQEESLRALLSMVGCSVEQSVAA